MNDPYCMCHDCGSGPAKYGYLPMRNKKTGEIGMFCGNCLSFHRSIPDSEWEELS